MGNEIILEPESCPSNGYSCVPNDDCDEGVIDIRDSSKLTGDYVCKDTSLKCCHEESIRDYDYVEENVCSDYASYNYTCVERTNCLDKFFESTDNGFGLDLRSLDCSNPELATCPNGDHVCCLKKKQTVEPRRVSECPAKEEKKCVALEQCNNEAILTNSLEQDDFYTVSEDGIVTVDAGHNLCEVDNEVCCTPKDPVDPCNKYESKRQYEPKCGQHNSNGAGLRITNPLGGKEQTQFAEWPHACIIYKKTTGGSQDKEFLGGASLISPGIVVTATHKVNLLAPSQILVRCGDWNRLEDNEQKTHQDRDVKYLSDHPRYSGLKRVKNDISLLHLTENFNLDTHLDTICLPTLINNREDNYDKEDCVVMGWGKNKFNNVTEKQRVLKQVELPIVDNDECQRLLRKTRLGQRFDLHESFLCAGGLKNADACTGDGGASLVCPSKNKSDVFVLAAMVAWGIGCGRENVPGAYVAISDQLCFIDWATKCKHGNIYDSFYDYSSECGNDWIDKEISKLNEEIKERKKKGKKASPLDTYLREAKELKASCKYRYTPETPERENEQCPKNKN